MVDQIIGNSHTVIKQLSQLRPPPDQDTRIVVIEIDGEPTVTGILADKVYVLRAIDETWSISVTS